MKTKIHCVHVFTKQKVINLEIKSESRQKDLPALQCQGPGAKKKKQMGRQLQGSLTAPHGKQQVT